jgi:3-methylcrotonyl-CoA carboxylase alpha subunit
MTTYRFNDTPERRHRVAAHAGTIRVDGVELAVREVGPGCFVTSIDGRNERLYAVARDDAIHVQLKGRAWRLERIDPTRPASAAPSGGAGSLHAPMPGVVVSILVEEGRRVKKGDPLLLIESMKLQMTISAPQDGEVAELPFAVGRTFQRGAVLVKLRAQGDAG